MNPRRPFTLRTLYRYQDPPYMWKLTDTMTDSLLHGATATYDPSDDKLRLSVPYRLDAEDYARAKSVGFRWAPKQEVFYAVWNPDAEALLIEWCGEIGDEDTTLADRAEDRAERFEGYSLKRETEGDRENRAASDLAASIPFGQPILVGHHSERRARKDAERIDRGLEKAVKLWETSAYWQRRAQGVIRSAEYKDTPAVRARRIKRLEAECKKHRAEFTPQGDGIPFDAFPWDSRCIDEREREPHVMTGQGRAMRPTPVRHLAVTEERLRPWIAHLTRRIDYERAILDTQGASALLERPKRPKLPPILNYLLPGGEAIVVDRFSYTGGTVVMPQVSMTKAEFKALGKDYTGTVTTPDRSHRLRMGMVPEPGKPRWQAVRSAVFLTDSKAHPIPSTEPEVSA